MAKYTIKNSKMKKKKASSGNSDEVSYTQKETVEEYLARGGKITICPPYRDPNRLPGDPPRPLFDPKGMYDLY